MGRDLFPVEGDQVPNEIGLFIAGFDDPTDVTEIAGEEQFYDLLEEATGAANSRLMLSKLAKARPAAKANPRLNAAVKRIASVAKQVQVQSGRIEAEWLRRPNTLVAIYTPNIANGATSAFSIQPGTGTSYYRLLGFICSDEQANVFGFSSLKVGGQEHVNFTQSTPSAPVANAVPWNIFALKESRLSTNLAPWSGTLFDPSQPITGTIVNMTTAAAGDVVTLAARITLLCQTDPCGMRYQKMVEASSRMFGSMRQALGVYGSMVVPR